MLPRTKQPAVFVGVRQKQRSRPCGYCGTQTTNRVYCGRSCGFKATRAKQTPEQRSAIGKQARAAQRSEDWERLKARLRVFGETEEQRWFLAYCYGRDCAKVRRYRAKGADGRAGATGRGGGR